MASNDIEYLIKELDAKLGDRSLITIRQLVDFGFFGSMSSARTALAEGHLPFIVISRRRRAIPKQALISYIQANFYQD